MATLRLLPHQVKKWGAWLMPLGLTGWVAGQRGFNHKLLATLRGDELQTISRQARPPLYYSFNTFMLVLTFFSFLFGIAFLIFPKKKRRRICKNSTTGNLSAGGFISICLFTFYFAGMFLFGFEPKSDGGLVLLFLAAIALFWTFYILRFNYILHWRR